MTTNEKHMDVEALTTFIDEWYKTLNTRILEQAQARRNDNENNHESSPDNDEPELMGGLAR